MTFLVCGLHFGSVHLCVRVDDKECGNLKVPWRAFKEMAKNKYIRFVFV